MYFFFLIIKYGAISMWDYSFAAPYAMINTNPTLPGAAKDVVFFCANKFIGGVQAPSKLIIIICITIYFIFFNKSYTYEFFVNFMILCMN